MEILNNEFIYMNTAGQGTGILGVEAGGLSYSGWKIIGNRFNSCVVGININGRACLVRDNTLSVVGITSAGAVGTVMTLGPKTIEPEALAAEALGVMNLSEKPFTAMFVVEDGRPIGIVSVHDLLRAGVM